MGRVLADLSESHDDLVEALDASEDCSPARLQKSVKTYTRAVSRYRAAVHELVATFEYLQAKTPPAPGRRRCRTRRWGRAEIEKRALPA